MRHSNSRTIKVKKSDLIDKINENKNLHIAEYNNAVILYKEEALKQLNALINATNNGDLEIKLNLVTPVNNVENYDKIIEMFTWEVDDIVELSQDEFLEYVQDETDFARSAKFSNAMYVSRF